jgi:hypothetical protein
MLSSQSRKPWYLLVLPAAALLAVLGYRSGLAQSGAGAEQAVAGQVEAALVANAASPRPTRPPPVLRERSTAIGPGLPVDLRGALEDGGNLFDYARQLRLAAAAGDAEAAWVVSRIYDYCGLYALDPQSYALDSAMLAGLGLDDAPGLIAARQRVSQRCSGFTAADQLGRPLLLQQRRQAARAGNLAAEAALLAMGEPLHKEADYRRGLVERVQQSQDPEAFLAISPAMGVMAAGDDALSGLVAGSQFTQLAWQVAACRLGLACGPDSVLMNSYCANGGICSRDPGQDFESFVFDAAVPRQGVEKMNELVSYLRKARGGAR